MTEQEKAAARFEMDGVTLGGGDWTEAQRALKECAQRRIKSKANKQTDGAERRTSKP